MTTLATYLETPGEVEIHLTHMEVSQGGVDGVTFHSSS